jgi:hypothetical protein
MKACTPFKRRNSISFLILEIAVNVRVDWDSGEETFLFKALIGSHMGYGPQVRVHFLQSIDDDGTKGIFA